MSNSDKDDRTVMMTDLPHFLKKMEEEEQAAAPEASAEDDDATAMMTSDMAAQIDAMVPSTEAAAPAPAPADDDGDDATAMMTSDMAAQIDGMKPVAPVPASPPAPSAMDSAKTMATDAFVKESLQQSTSGDAEFHKASTMYVEDAGGAAAPPAEPVPAPQQTLPPTAAPDWAAEAAAAPAPAPGRVAKPARASGGGTALLTLGAMGAFASFVAIGLYVMVPFMQSSEMVTMGIPAGGLGFVAFLFVGLGFFGASSRTGAMAIVTGIFTCLASIMFALFLVALAAKSKDLFQFLGHGIPTTFGLTMILVGVWSLGGGKRGSAGLSITHGILALLGGVLVLTTWILVVAKVRVSVGVGMSLLISAWGLSGIAMILLGINFIKLRKV